MARQGKIARLPHALREEVNSRLLNGETSGVILAWLNAHKDAIRIWDQYFEGSPATAQNLSEWRLGGFKEWLSRKERADDLKTLSTFALDLAKSGGNIADGAAAILSGHILEALETFGNVVVTGGKEDADKDPAEGLAAMAKAVSSLQKSQVAREKLTLDKRKTAQKDEEIRLAREKFEKQTVDKFMQFAQTKEAQAILNSGAKKSVQMAELRKLMFGAKS